MKQAFGSGIGAAFFRAVGMLYPGEKRICEDPVAEKLLTPLYKFFLNLMRSPRRFDSMIALREKMTPGILGWMFCRTRYIDDVVEKSMSSYNIRTIVNLGAGMDSRAYRIPERENVRFFEVDHPRIIKMKKAKIKKILGKLPGNVMYVPVDFNRQHLSDELDKAGYKTTEKTLFIWEGVTQYISADANGATFSYISKAAPGSRVVFTYIVKSLLDGDKVPEGLEKFQKLSCKKKNPLWVHGFKSETMADYLSKYSLSLIEDLGADDFQKRYMNPAGLGLKIFGIERMVLAERLPVRK